MKHRKQPTKKASSKKQQPVEAGAAGKAPETTAAAPTLAQGAPGTAKANKKAKASKKAVPDGQTGAPGQQESRDSGTDRPERRRHGEGVDGGHRLAAVQRKGFISNLVRKDGQKIEAIKRESGERCRARRQAGRTPPRASSR